MRLTGRVPVTLLTAGAAIGAALAAQSAGSGVGSLGWAMLAGVGLSTMLRGIGLRVLGLFLVAVGVGGAIWSASILGWLGVACFVVGCLGSAAFVIWGPGWRARSGSGTARPKDLWAAMDDGEDPTAN